MKTQRLCPGARRDQSGNPVSSAGPDGADDAQSVTPTLRARVIELVDERGRVRSRLNVESGREVVSRGANGRRVIRP